MPLGDLKKELEAADSVILKRSGVGINVINPVKQLADSHTKLRDALLAIHKRFEPGGWRGWRGAEHEIALLEEALRDTE